jgi:hypothetical protein
MRRELTTHFVVLVSYILLVTIYKTLTAMSFALGWFDFAYLPFWVGGVIGVILPYSDHFLYAYLIKPDDSISQRISSNLSNKNFSSVLNTLNRSEATVPGLVFHKAYFQLLFVLFALFVVTSSGSLLGRGIVLGFLLHLLVDQWLDYKERGSIDGWFEKLPFKLDQEQQKRYFYVNLVVLMILGLFF